MTLSDITTSRGPHSAPHGDCAGYLPVAAADALAIDTPLRVELTGRPPITVVATADGIFAVDDTCSHQDTSLSAGWVEDCAIECPLHEACFDLRTGAAMGPPATRPIATHPVRVVDGIVEVWMDDAETDAA
ncbi:bifunctional 3-phenylpropionate/cinnamic acid dioxygenase ferredoxin subunit [Williamsia deligens]|uniref:Bifunctional 3-phenylpropionate/cinnamic acid dioxygenase ferredoxin subunit n=1 Tax=Williamsia deligens TaxID=321325 RepID=A0ABW3GBL0_9NOCA|nr:bifunctional 3-phenylpropionate/cinnamic acid dioxygenase ferredoxin subunit [Williamsia deligens]MCP2195475.1 3-phenylpropionate/trans-cinnamate dioxygenase ferredoxin subunit [Williamsia deligens]